MGGISEINAALLAANVAMSTLSEMSCTGHAGYSRVSPLEEPNFTGGSEAHRSWSRRKGRV
ncbi:MAG: hypothetical protein EAZ43_16765 [Betaproteobacteria bacterium]|nr:MAG: hypothetical protein EAZ43_16765 [Betaproteobacteria bacterium]